MRGTFWQLKASFTRLLLKKWIFYRGPKRSNKIALTFDDGPHPQHTLDVLSVLADFNAKASFFFIGKHIDQYPEIVHQVHTAGHLIGGHGFNHLRANEISLRQFEDELLQTQAVLQTAIDQQYHYFRPPYGCYQRASLKACATQNITTVLWSVDSRDFEQKSKQHIINNVMRDKVQGGDILLFHDNNAFTPQALSEILSQLQQHYDFVRVDELH